LGFINVDLIAAALSPFDPDRAALRARRILLNEIKRRVRAGENSAFETTLSGRSCARTTPGWWEAGYNVTLAFLGLPTAYLDVTRMVACRPGRA